MKYFLVYKCTCASCSSSYIGETCHHLKTRIEEHIKNDNKSHIVKHLHSTATCFDSYNSLSFKTTDKANSKFELIIKEALHINWRKPNLNAQQNQLVLTLLLLLPFILFLSAFFPLAFLLPSIFIISDTNHKHQLLSEFTLRYYFISLQHTLHQTFLFDLLFSLSPR